MHSERLTAADGNLVVPSPGSSAVTRAAFFGKVTERSDTLVDAARAAAFPVVCGTALDGVTELRLPIEGSNALIGVFFLESGRVSMMHHFLPCLSGGL